MKLNTSTLVLTFIWCWFMGVTAISIGLGDVFPSMNRVAQPFVCPNGSMEMDQDVYNPYPGKTVTTTTWYCVDKALGTQTELAVFPMALYNGTLYGLLLFIVVLAGMVLLDKKLNSSQSRVTTRQASIPSSRNTLSRMNELKKLRAANLISESEYEQKRAEILKSL